MTQEWGVTFSPAMARALWRGDKTQTRRLATSPLAKRRAGDKLIVREHWRTTKGYDKLKPSLLPVVPVYYLADGTCTPGVHSWGKFRQGMHMPHLLSRMTLTILETRFEKLLDITPEAAIAEGISRHGPNVWHDYLSPAIPLRCPRESYFSLWDKLHGDYDHLNNPEVLVIEFSVERKSF